MADKGQDDVQKQRLRELFTKMDVGGTGAVSRSALYAILSGVGIDKEIAKVILDAADTKKDGQIKLDFFFDWLFASPEQRRTMMHDSRDEALVRTGGPLFVGTLNFLGNAYNAVEFMNIEEDFVVNYELVRKNFGELTGAQVLAEAEKLEFDKEKMEKLVEVPSDPFEKVCTKEFLGRDNKFELNLRTNMVVAGMMPTNKGPPLYHSLKDWRSLMHHQVDNYDKDPQLALWDIACNMAAENSKDAFDTLCGKSYLNPENTMQNVQTLLNQLPRGRDVVCAVQEFPEKDTAKNLALMGELPTLGLKVVKPLDANSSVGFIISAGLKVLGREHAPLGRDPEEVYGKIQAVVKGLPPWEDVDPKDRESLTTTCFKTFVVDLEIPTSAENDKDTTPVRFASVHAKEFKSDQGTKIFAAYLRALGGDMKAGKIHRAAVILTDSNTPDAAKSKIFDESLTANGFHVLSPADCKYTTTRKQRSQMHGQIYDGKKCLKTVSAHKTFAALLQSDQGPPVWEAISEKLDNGMERWAKPFPDLVKEDRTTLPHIGWPTDHCMLQVQLQYKAVKEEKAN